MNGAQAQSARSFLSSTFRDFGEELNMLTKQVSPLSAFAGRSRLTCALWGAAPLEGSVSKTFPVRDPGACGVVPLNSLGLDSRALAAWLADLTAHAAAWGQG